MGRVKDRTAHEKLLFPNQKDIIESIFHPPQKLTWAQAHANIQNAEKSKPKYKIKIIQETFKEKLVSSHLFKISHDKILFCNPIFPSKTIKNSGKLLNELSLDLANFYYHEFQKMLKIGPAAELHQVQLKLISLKPALIEAKIKEKKIHEIIYTLRNWERKLYRVFNQITKPTQINKILIPSLIETFRKFTNNDELSDRAVYKSIAKILKCLSLKGGDLNLSAATIKTTMIRIRGKAVTT